MKYIVAGGRNFNNYLTLSTVLCWKINPLKDEIVSGDAQGADTGGARWAEKHNVPIHHFPANWDEFGITAGYIRNAEMGNFADAAIIFWNGKTKGTTHMIKTMKFADKPYWVYDYEGKLQEQNKKAKEIDEMNARTGQSMLNWKANEHIELENL